MKRRRLEDPISEVGNQPQSSSSSSSSSSSTSTSSSSSSSSDGNSEEGNSKESGTSAASSHYAEKCSCDDEHSTDESARVTLRNLDDKYVPSSHFYSSSSKEETSSSEEKCYENKTYVSEFGLLFLKCHRKASWDIKIVLVGHRDCGKSQLIKSVFGDHPSFTSKNLGNRDEYHIALNKKAHFHFWIYDVMDVEYIQEAEFPSRTAILFCYDSGDLHTLKELEDTWKPLFFNDIDETLLHILVEIERDPATEEMAAERAKNEEEFKAAKRVLSGFFFRHDCRTLTCNFEDELTMLDVFQKTINIVYPKDSSR